MHKIGSVDELRANVACDEAFAEYMRLLGVLQWLVAAAMGTTDRAVLETIDLLIGRCRPDIDVAKLAWLRARRAWSDAAGLDIEPIDGI
ncbi:hypothetical protein [Frankia gtarii]|uniref:hypothetical protein n=1 Tax=Frankia gtarii TaxID=2950102 RepID=UPI0021C02763|nr:hypothetical protein [Frankia gtarii]